MTTEEEYKVQTVSFEEVCNRITGILMWMCTYGTAIVFIGLFIENVIL